MPEFRRGMLGSYSRSNFTRKLLQLESLDHVGFEHKDSEPNSQKHLPLKIYHSWQ